jgi:hypothetical protein
MHTGPLARVAGVSGGMLQEITQHTGTLSPQSAILAEIYERRRHTAGDAYEEHHMRVVAEVPEAPIVARCDGGGSSFSRSQP